jgi:hypothetical protein
MCGYSYLGKYIRPSIWILVLGQERQLRLCLYSEYNKLTDWSLDQSPPFYFWITPRSTKAAMTYIPWHWLETTQWWCGLRYQPSWKTTGAPLRYIIKPVLDRRVTTSPAWSESTNWWVIKVFPLGGGASGGIGSLISPQDGWVNLNPNLEFRLIAYPYLYGESIKGVLATPCNPMQFDAPSCNPVQPRSTKEEGGCNNYYGVFLLV